jgi:hypothetical protein
VIDIRLGDCLEVLRTIPDGSARMCVTSPPYYGLRDYGVDGQIGLEATPDAFVAKMVEVFREVRRVLADDGTCWVNLGSSYASSTLRETQTPQPSRAPACGSGGIGSQDSQAVDHACLGSCGERSDETPNHRAGIVHTGRCAGPDEPPTWQTNRDSETEDCGPSSPVVSDPCDPRSTTPRSSYRPRLACGQPTHRLSHLCRPLVWLTALAARARRLRLRSTADWTRHLRARHVIVLIVGGWDSVVIASVV